MREYKLRIPAISQLWRKVHAKSEDEAFDKVVSELEAANPKIQWRDRDVWEIERVIDPIVERKIQRLAWYIVENKKYFTIGDKDRIASQTIDELESAMRGDPDYLPHSDRLRGIAGIIVENKKNFTVGDYSRNREKIIEELRQLLEM